MHNVSRPPFLFTSGKHNSPAPPLPERNGELQPPTLEYIHLFRHSSAPATAREVIAKPDMPILHVNLNVYSDVTLVGFRYPHALVDLPGLAVIMRGWLSALDGRVSDLPPALSKHTLRDFAKPYPKTASALKEFRRDMKSSLTIWSPWEKIRIYLPMVKEFIIHKKEADHSLFLSEKLIRNLREHAMKELGGQWLSENDIITAILTKINLIGCRDKGLRTPLTLVMTVNLRGRVSQLPKSILPSYIHNCILNICAPAVPTAKMQEMSIAQVASLVRDTVKEQRTQDQLVKIATVYQEQARQQSFTAANTPPSASFFVTSWMTSGLSNLNFSAALVEGKGPGGNVVFAGGYSNGPEFPVRFFSLIMGKHHADQKGEAGVWVELAVRSKAIAEVKGYLDALFSDFSR